MATKIDLKIDLNSHDFKTRLRNVLEDSDLSHASGEGLDIKHLKYFITRNEITKDIDRRSKWELVEIIRSFLYSEQTLEVVTTMLCQPAAATQSRIQKRPTSRRCEPAVSRRVHPTTNASLQRRARALEAFKYTCDKFVRDGSIVSVGVELELPGVFVKDNDNNNIHDGEVIATFMTEHNTIVDLTSDICGKNSYSEFLVFNPDMPKKYLDPTKFVDSLNIGILGSVATFYSDEVATMLSNIGIGNKSSIKGMEAFHTTVKGGGVFTTYMPSYVITGGKGIKINTNIRCVKNSRLPECTLPVRIASVDFKKELLCEKMGLHMTLGLYLDRLIPFFTRYLDLEYEYKTHRWVKWYDQNYEKLKVRYDISDNVAALHCLCYVRGMKALAERNTAGSDAKGLDKGLRQIVPLLRNDVREIFLNLSDKDKEAFARMAEIDPRKYTILGSCERPFSVSNLDRWARSSQLVDYSDINFSSTDSDNVNISSVSSGLLYGVPTGKFSKTFNAFRTVNGRIKVYIELRSFHLSFSLRSKSTFLHLPHCPVFTSSLPALPPLPPDEDY